MTARLRSLSVRAVEAVSVSVTTWCVIAAQLPVHYRMLARPERDIYFYLPAKPGRAVMVLHSWWGYTKPFQKLCEVLSGNGFFTVAVDLFSGSLATTESQARKLRARKRVEPMHKTLVRAIDLALMHPQSRGDGISVIGFSMGAHWAFWLSGDPAYRVHKVASFYGLRNIDFTKSSAEYQIHLAESDPWVKETAARKMERSLESAGRTYEILRYPETTHWFFESDRKEYNKQQSEVAFRNLLSFLKRRRDKPDARA